MLVDRGAVRASAVAGPLGVALVALLVLWASSARAELPDGRRYELVTPVQKNAADVLPNPQRTRAAASGGAIAFSSLTGFGDVQGGSRATDYVAVRGLDGVWRTHGIFPMQDASSFIPDVPSGLEPRYLGEFSGDLSRGVFLAKTPVTAAPDVAHAVNLYLRTDLLSPGAGAYQLLTNAVTDQGVAYEPQIQPVLADASADFSHILFESTRSLVAETASVDPTAVKLYAWVDGAVRFVGMVPNGTDTACGGGGNVCVVAPQSQAGRGASVENAYTTGTISQNGQRVIFTVQSAALHHSGQLYLRDDRGTASTDDDTTVQINASERTDCSGDPTCGGDTVPDPAPDTPESATFWAASSDGSKIFLTTPEQLTDDDPNDSEDLYLYDLDATGDHLTRLSVDTELSDNPNSDVANGHQVVGVFGASQDGSTVYFAVNGGQLIATRSIVPPVGNAGAAGDARIYVWRNGVLHEVGGVNGSFSTELSRMLGASGWGRQSKWSRITSDGSHFAFVTQGTDQLLSNYNKPEYNHGTDCSSLTSSTACLEVYVYDADANGDEGDLQCASCQPTGTEAKGDAQFVIQFAGGATLDASHLNHALSDDGHYVFFDSTDQLVPDDKNTVADAYEFDTHTGQLHLLGSGFETNRQIFLDASADGSDVFILTRKRLRSEDHDQSADIYDVRINGTPDPGPPSNASCEAEGCRPTATPTATLRKPASTLFTGPDDRLELRGPSGFFHTQSLTARQRRQLANHGATRLTISASAPGSVVVRVAVRTGGHLRTIQVIRRDLKRGMTLHPRIRLTESARRALATRGRLRVVITTTYSQAARPQITRATLTDSGR